MQYQRFFGALAWSSILVGALLFTGCGSSSSDGGNPDATGPVDTGGGGTDTGGAVDTGMVAYDSGIHPDASRMDIGPGDGHTADVGPIDMMMNAEGHSCTADGVTAHGSCTSSTAVCFTWSPMNVTPPVSTCMQQCQANADCMHSTVGQVCATIAFDHVQWIPIKACVSAAISTEGSLATASLLHQDSMGRPIPMTGCADPLTPVYRLDGTLLLANAYDQLSCTRPCAADGDCMAAAPTCTTGVYTSTLAVATKKGLCTLRKAGKGAKCSEVRGTEICDTSQSQAFVCLNIGFNDGDNTAVMGMDEKYGVCLEICDNMVMTCAAKADMQHTGTCKFGFFTSPTLGLCSDSCSAFPNNCTGHGSPPPAGVTGAMARGASCFQFRGMNGTVDMPEEALCLEVDEEGPLFTPFTNLAGMPPAVGCDTNAISCPVNTTCIGLDQRMHTGCVYGCNTTTATTGCSGTGTSTCVKAFGMAKAGVCAM